MGSDGIHLPNYDGFRFLLRKKVLRGCLQTQGQLAGVGGTNNSHRLASFFPRTRLWTQIICRRKTQIAAVPESGMVACMIIMLHGLFERRVLGG